MSKPLKDVLFNFDDILRNFDKALKPASEESKEVAKVQLNTLISTFENILGQMKDSGALYSGTFPVNIKKEHLDYRVLEQFSSIIHSKEYRMNIKDYSDKEGKVICEIYLPNLIVNNAYGEKAVPGYVANALSKRY